LTTISHSNLLAGIAGLSRGRKVAGLVHLPGATDLEEIDTMSTHDVEKLFSLLIVLAIAWATYESLAAIHEAVSEPEEVQECVTESGHKKVECE